MSKVGTADLVLVSFGGVTFLGMFIVMGVYLYWGYTRMDSILAGLKNCLLVNRYRFYLYMGPLGRLMMIGGVAGCFAFSRYLIRNGLLNSEDINDFPEPLKGRLILSHYIALGLIASLFIEAIAVKILRGQVQL